MNMVEIAGSPFIMLDSKAIDDDPGPFCMSFGFTLGPLIHSIQKSGLINPPIVVKQGEGRFDVVSGYRRILALKNLHIEKIPCRDITDSDFSSRQVLLLNFYDNFVTRKFNEVEKGMILARLAHYIPRQEIIQSYMPLLSLPSREETLDLFLNIEGQSHSIKEALAHGDLSVKAFETLLKVDYGILTNLVKSILDLKLNFNQQLQFIEIAIDICIRDDITIPELLNQTPFLRIIENERLNLPQKAKAILELLKSIRFPLLTRSEKSFRNAVLQLGLPDGTRIFHPPFFEGAEYRLEVFFKNGRQLKERIKILDNLERIETLGDPWHEEET
jgi:hypothetical protein